MLRQPATQKTTIYWHKREVIWKESVAKAIIRVQSGYSGTILIRHL